MSGLASKRTSGPTSELGSFIDRLIQGFEDCRPGLSDGAVREGDAAVERFFLELYGREGERLQALVRGQSPHLKPEAQDALSGEVDAVIRRAVIPGYVRLARTFTAHERNDFYLTRGGLHGLERMALGLAGMLVGIFVVIAPFIPLWEKWWIIPFMVSGLLFPEIRRYLALRRYERALNELVGHADRELARIDLAYLTHGDAIEELASLGASSGASPETSSARSERETSSARSERETSSARSERETSSARSERETSSARSERETSSARSERQAEEKEH